MWGRIFSYFGINIAVLSLVWIQFFDIVPEPVKIVAHLVFFMISMAYCAMHTVYYFVFRDEVKRKEFFDAICERSATKQIPRRTVSDNFDTGVIFLYVLSCAAAGFVVTTIFWTMLLVLERHNRVYLFDSRNYPENWELKR
jgi:hypothetical protein